MNLVTEFRTSFNIPPQSHSIHRLLPVRTILARAVVLLFMVTGIASVAGAQSLGYVVNSTDRTVTVFGSATVSVGGQSYSDDTLQTVTFPTQSGQSAPGLVGTAAAPAAGSNTPPARLVYVTDQTNNQLWAFDVSTISQANAVAKPVSFATGSCTTPLFNQPGAIVIATPSSFPSGLASVVNQGNGTVSIIDLGAASCVAQTSALGTITGITASPDMTEVFVLATNVGTPPAPALWVINATATPTATQIDMSQVKLVNPISIAVQNDTASCYFIAIGDQGNSTLFIAAVGPANNTDTNCPDGVTPTAALLVQSVSLADTVAPNPIGAVSTFAPGLSGGQVYVADAANNLVWEVDCSVPNEPPVYACDVSDSGPVGLTNNATPTTIGLSLLQTIPVDITAAKRQVKRVRKAAKPAAEEDLTFQYLYVAGTSSSGLVFDYADVGFCCVDILESFNSSAVTVGNGPQGLNFSGVDPSSPPVTWFMTGVQGTTSVGGTLLGGPIWVMPVTGELNALGSTIVNLNSANSPTFSLNFGTTAVNGLFPATTLFCAPFDSNLGGIADCPGSSPEPGVNALGGSSSTTSGGEGGSLPASTVFTVTLEACSEAPCPASPSPSTDTVLTQQVNAGAVCTLSLTPSPNTGLDNVSIGQTVNAEITCVAPVSGATAPVGDGISATIEWAPGATIGPPITCTTETCTLSTPVNGYQYENAVMPFPPNSYGAAGNYTVSVNGTDTAEGVPIFLTGTSGMQTITVVGPSVTVSPASTVSQPLPVLLSGTEAFTGVVNNSATAPTVTWTLTSGGSACSPACGTMSNETVSSLPTTGTLNYNIAATYTAPAAVFAGTITLTVSADGANAQAFLVINGPTISVNPAGTSSAPLQVQLLGTQAFSGVAGNSPGTPTVTWMLTSGGSACSPACGAISNTQTAVIAGTPNYNISATYTAPAAVFAGTITLTVSANGVNAQAFIQTTTSTTTPPPSCSFSSPPATGQTGLAVTVTLACTGPANDSLSATVDFSDGAPVITTGTIIQSGSLTLTFAHTYSSAGTYAVSVTSIADTTSGLFGTPPAALSIVVYLTPTVTPVQSSVPLAPGQSATFGVNFAGGLSDANLTFTNFACQNLPTGATCTFSPASITLDANGNSNNTLQVTVTLASSTSAREVQPRSPQQMLLVASLWSVPLFGIVFLGAGSGGRGKRRRQVWCGLLLVLVLMLMWIPACSSVSQSTLACPTCATPGNYTVNVTGSSVNPALQATTVFTLQVEP
jgi:hypothetical protein